MPGGRRVRRQQKKRGRGDADVKRRPLHITFQPHALERLAQRLPNLRREKLRGRLRNRIPSVLRNGAPVVYGAIRVEVQPDVICVCAPDIGGWVVVTIIDKSVPREAEECI